MPWLTFVFQWLVLFLGLYILGRSAQFLVTAVTRIGHSLGLSQFITGFVILGIATSTPEIFVGIQSALANTPQLSLGNLFGANVVLLTLIGGMTALLNRGVNTRTELANSNRLIHISLLILAPLMLIIDSHLSRLDALFLFVMYVGYIIYTYKQEPKDSPPLTKPLLNHQVWHTSFLAIIGLLGLTVASKAVVATGLQIADFLKIPELFVGTILLSLGTNLPEISVVFAAIRRRHTNLVIGDVLGSATTNTLVISLLGGITPFTVQAWAILESAGIMMVLALGAFFWFAKSKKKLSTLEGLVLIGLYAAFLASQISSLYLQ